MDTLFLFSSHLDEQGCLCLKIKMDGNLDHPPTQLSFEEIHALQKNCKTLVIESAINASLLPVELPWLPERKARVAIPYALEEELAQPVDELHFAFDKIRYQNKQYLITVISKCRIRYIMQILSDNDIEYTAITLDWFALEPHELCVRENILLISTDEFKGALSGELADAYLKKHFAQHPILFSDSQIQTHTIEKSHEESSHTWIAQRLLKNKVLNLCQGDMQHEDKTELLKKGYQLAAALFGVWLISLVVVNAIEAYLLGKQTQKIDDQIAVIYKEFFPDAKQVISPQFRINQLLKNNDTEEQTRFWFLLNQFAKVMQGNQYTLEQLRYENKSLTVNLICPDFASLEKLENELKKAQLKVKQTQASTRAQQVFATLELT